MKSEVPSLHIASMLISYLDIYNNYTVEKYQTKTSYKMATLYFLVCQLSQVTVQDLTLGGGAPCGRLRPLFLFFYSILCSVGSVVLVL